MITDLAAVERHLDAAREGLRRLGAMAAQSGVGLPGSVVSSWVAAAMAELDEAVGLLFPPPAEVKVGACPFCGLRIMAGATLCAFCWRELKPAVSG